MEAMDGKELERLLKDMARAKIRNYIREVRKSYSQIILHIFMIVTILFACFMLAFIFKDSSGRIKNYEPLVIACHCVVGFVAFILGATITLRISEMEYFTIKNINIHNIMRFKLKKQFRTTIIISLLCVLFYAFLSRKNDDIGLMEYGRLLLSLTAFSIVMMSLIPLIGSLFYRIKSTAIKRLIILVIITTVLSSIVQFLYFLNRYLPDHDFHSIWRDFHLNPPINILLSFPLASIHVAAARTFDPLFWLSFVFVSGITIVTVVFMSRYGLEFHPDRTVEYMRVVQNNYQQEVPSGTIWYRRGRFRKMRIKYPNIKNGKWALFELNLHHSLKFHRVIISIILLLVFGTLFVLAFMYRPIEMVDIPIFSGFFVFSIVSLLSISIGGMDVNNLFTDKIRFLPLKGYHKVLFFFFPHVIISTSVYLILSTIGIFLLSINEIEYIILIVWNGNILIVFLSASIIMDYSFFLVKMKQNQIPTVQINQLTQDTPLHRPNNMTIFPFLTISFGCLFFFIFLLLDQIFSYTVTFTIIGFLMLGMIPLLLKIAGREFEWLGVKKRRMVLRYIISIIVCVVLVIPAGYGAYYKSVQLKVEYLGYDDLVIDELYVIEGRNISFRRDLVVLRGGTLEIRNSTVLFEDTKLHGFGIHTLEGSSLVIENSTVRGRGSEYGFVMSIYGCGSIRNSTLSNMQYRSYQSGMHIMDTTVVMEYTMIRDSGADGILCENSNVTMMGCTFSQCKGDALGLQDGQALIENCTFSGNGDNGIYIDVTNATIRNCHFEDNGEWGVFSLHLTPDLENNTFSGNGAGEVGKP